MDLSARTSWLPAGPARSARRSSSAPATSTTRGGPRVQPRRAQAVRAAARGIDGERRLRFLIGDVRDRDRLSRATPRRRRDRPRGRAQAGAGVRVQPVRGRADQRHRRRERGRRGDRERGVHRRLAAQHRQGGQPGQPVRRDQALRGEDLHPGQRVRRRFGGALRLRPLRQRRRQPRQRDPAVPGSRRRRAS